MKRAARHKTGSVVFDRRRKTWNFLWWEHGKRRSRMIGSHRQYPTKASAWSVAKTFQNTPENQVEDVCQDQTVNMLVDHYRAEKMPRRVMTRQGYNTWLNHYIVPNWGNRTIQELQARPVDLWLQSLTLAPKSKAHIRGLIRVLWDFAMWRGEVPVQRNPMELVTIKGATKRTRHARSLTVEEFQQLVQHLQEPFRTMARVCVCFGLRISECLALKWSDVDWLNATLRIERGIVHQVVDNVKTAESQRTMHVEGEMLDVLKKWKQMTRFSSSEDWIFASPVQLGRLPISYAAVWRVLRKAAAVAGIGQISSHTFRHTYRTWLDSVGTPVGVQQRLMRHTDIRTTMNVYGAAITADMRQAQEKVVRLALQQA